MNKSSRIVILTITAVMTVAVFFAMVATRPTGEGNEILEAARERQSKNLVDVREPLETDVKAITEAEKLRDEVREMLLGDEDFSKSVASLLSESEEFKAMYMPEVVAKSEESAKAVAEDAAISVSEKHAGEIAERKVSEAVSLYKTQIYEIAKNAASESVPTVEEAVDALVAPVTERVYAEVTSKFDAYIDEAVKSSLDGSSSEGEVDRAMVEEMLKSYKEELVVEVSEKVLAEVEKKLGEAVEAMNAQAKATGDSRISPTPTFPSSTVSEDEYEAERAKRREDAIKGVLEKLK